MTIPHKTRQDAEDQEEREREDVQTLAVLTALSTRLRRIRNDRLLDISDEEWQAAQDAEDEQERRDAQFAGEADIAEAQPWQILVNQLTPVGQIAHGAAMADDTSEQVTRGELTAERARNYEKELKRQARRVGCDQYRGQLSIGPEWVELDQRSVDDARSITNTYNRDLARKITQTRQETPRANRNTYAKRIRDWSKERDAWKDKDIRTQTANSARAQAQRDFYQKNGITEGHAVLRPRTAVCKICLGWIARGEVPVNVATSDAPPYHNFCNPAGTKILTPVGERNIEDFVLGDVVTTRAGNCLVGQAFQRSVAEPIYRVSAGGRSLRLTGEHPVLTRDGWTHAHALKVGQEIMMVAGREDLPDDNGNKE